MREATVEQYLVAQVKRKGGEVRKVQWIGRRGAPDRLVLLPGRAPTLVELKAPGKKAQPHQLREHDRLRSYGFTVLVIDSFDGVENLTL